MDHALAEAEDLEAEARQKIGEAMAAMQRAAALRLEHEIAIQHEKPPVKENGNG